MKATRLSWYQPSDDHRPMTFPPPEPVIAWWCSGVSEQGATLIAIVRGQCELDAWVAIRNQQAWPDAGAERFVQYIDIDTTKPEPFGDRFPLSDWMRTRLKEPRP